MNRTLVINAIVLIVAATMLAADLFGADTSSVFMSAIRRRQPEAMQDFRAYTEAKRIGDWEKAASILARYEIGDASPELNLHEFDKYTDRLEQRRIDALSRRIHVFPMEERSQQLPYPVNPVATIMAAPWYNRGGWIVLPNRYFRLPLVLGPTGTSQGDRIAARRCFR